MNKVVVERIANVNRRWDLDILNIPLKLNTHQLVSNYPLLLFHFTYFSIILLSKIY